MRGFTVAETCVANNATLTDCIYISPYAVNLSTPHLDLDRDTQIGSQINLSD
jgi:hypothetical protein